MGSRQYSFTHPMHVVPHSTEDVPTQYLEYTVYFDSRAFQLCSELQLLTMQVLRLALSHFFPANFCFFAGFSSFKILAKVAFALFYSSVSCTFQPCSQCFSFYQLSNFRRTIPSSISLYAPMLASSVRSTAYFLGSLSISS